MGVSASVGNQLTPRSTSHVHREERTDRVIKANGSPIVVAHLPLAKVMEDSMPSDEYRTHHGLFLLIVITTLSAVVVFGSTLIVQAQSDAPDNIYLVTSSADTVITTCAGGANDCTLRGAVQLANASSGGDTINFSPSVTAVTLNQPITVTGSSILINGNGSEVGTALRTNGNFAALVLNSNGNTVRGLWITSNGSHKGTSQHGIVINGNNNNVNHNSLSDLGGDGVYITGSPGNIIDSNLIGVQTLNGTQWAFCGYANDQWGILLDGANNNTVSHNTSGCNGQDGVGLYGNSYNNTVTDNYLGGVNWGGHIPNSRAGVGVWNGATVNHIGTQGHGNIIGTNGYGVILYGANTQDNTVEWNSVGVSGTLNISNTVDGFNLQQNTSGNWIQYNDIAYNGSSGVAFVLGATSNYVYSNHIHNQVHSGVWIGDASNNSVDVNWIGVDTSSGPAVGCTAANGDWGIRLDNAWSNSLNSNVIGCSGADGVGLSGTGTYSNDIYLNWIGVTNAGTHKPNAVAGVALWGGAHDNQIGWSNYGNIIGVNGTYGVYLGDSNTATNTVQLNSIGISGTLNISNTLDGVAIVGGARANRLYTNTISNNGHNGVWLSGAGTTNNLLQANTIRSNKLAGVAIQSGASANWIGLGGPRTAANVISANAYDGVYISDNTTVYNAVADNYIGTNATGNAADPNGGSGVVLDNGTFGNAIGWSVAERNVIAGNNGDGVSIKNGAHDNWVRVNDIGTNRDFPVAALDLASNQPTGGGSTYLAVPNGGGISIYNAYTNTIGGIAADNFIEHNHHTGVYLAGGSRGNIIGSNIVADSDDYGVLLDGNNTAYNTITRTQVYSSGLDGIGERNNATLNVWTEVSIHDNGGLGIDKSASNDGQNIVNAPNNFGIDSINRSTGAVHGHADASVLGTVTVELYRVSPDPSGFGEGGVFIGKVTTDGSGNWTIFDTSPAAVRGCYTAFVTESFFVIPPVSSEFSANTCRVFLPLATRQ